MEELSEVSLLAMKHGNQLRNVVWKGRRFLGISNKLSNKFISSQCIDCVLAIPNFPHNLWCRGSYHKRVAKSVFILMMIPFPRRVGLREGFVEEI